PSPPPAGPPKDRDWLPPSPPAARVAQLVGRLPPATDPPPPPQRPLPGQQTIAASFLPHSGTAAVTHHAAAGAVGPPAGAFPGIAALWALARRLDSNVAPRTDPARRTSVESGLREPRLAPGPDRLGSRLAPGPLQARRRWFDARRLAERSAAVPAHRLAR